MPLSNVKKSVPSGAIAIRASWLLRIGPLVTEIGVENVRAPSRENATCTGECPPNPLNWTHVTYTEPANGLVELTSTAIDSWSGNCPLSPRDLPLPFHWDTWTGLSRTPSSQVRPPSLERLTNNAIGNGGCEKMNAWQAKNAVPSGPNATAGSPAAS